MPTTTKTDFDYVYYMCTIHAIGIYKGHSDSQLSLKNGIASSRDRNLLKPELIEERAYRQAMDWIGNCFVKTQYGDVIAIAATIDQSTALHKITFHISNNIGLERIVESKKAIWPAFLEIMNKIKLLDLSKPEELKNGSQLLVKHIITNGWKRVLQKFSSIHSIAEKDNKIMFINLLQKLRDNHCITADDISLAYLTANSDATVNSLENGIMKLQGDMDTLLDLIREARSKPIQRLEKLEPSSNKFFEIFSKGVASARPILLVINSVLNNHRPDKAEIWKEDQQFKRFILKMHNRLSRLLKFESGAKLFVKNCLGIYRKFARLTQNSELQFEVVWIEEWVEDSGFPTSEISQSMTSVDYLGKLEEITERLFKEDKDALNKTTYNKLCKLVTDEIESKKSKKLELAPSLHCEISLAFYLEAKKLTPLYNFIGVTKLNCSSCSLYTQSYFEKRDLPYKMTGSSGKWHHNWLMPVEPAIRGVDSRLLAAMKDEMNVVRNQVLGYAELELKIILSRGDLPGGSVGSDSSTGSMNPILLQEV